MISVNTKDFKVSTDIRISDLPTRLDLKIEKQLIKDRLKDVRRELSKLQDVMYAHNRYSVLICLQGMDTAGKDSLIREVFKDFNSRGIHVHSFKKPNNTELSHNFLWRHYIALPAKGKFAVFNRTHYENVLASRVHPEFILNENLPGIEKVEDISGSFWEDRFDQINDFEKHLTANGTIILKFFLNISKEEQKQRLLRRLEEKKHNWKFSPGDLTERERWDDYMRFIGEAVNSTSTGNAPWYVVPADSKPMAILIVAQTILDTLRQYTDIEEPPLDADIEANIGKYITALKSE
jgi:PPK2 family polyphosphate:nucleotide phosphotransferase